MDFLMFGWFSLGGLFGSIASVVVSGVVGLGQQAIPLLAVGAGIKHGGKLPLVRAIIGPITRRIPNKLIPFVNLGVDLALGGGGAGAAAAALIHQGSKILTQSLFENKIPLVQRMVGPGDKVSI